MFLLVFCFSCSENPSVKMEVQDEISYLSMGVDHDAQTQGMVHFNYCIFYFAGLI